MGIILKVIVLGICILFISPIISFPPAYSISLVEIIKLIASDAVSGDRFGTSVSISGDTAIVGAIGDDDGGAASGSAYIFEKVGGTWSQTAKLTASDATSGDQFGTSVSISGDTAIVGALANSPGGSAYVFVKPGGGWADATEDAKLTASDAASGDLFGFTVSIAGDTAIVGALADDDAGISSGSAYVFVKPGGGWADATEDAKLTASDAISGAQFGNSVSISGDTAIFGARHDDDAGTFSGSAYVFVKPGGGWADATEDAKLTASDAAEFDQFGFFVSISGNTAVVGSIGDDDGGAASGSAYVFVKPGGGWADATEDAKLTASDPASGDGFGISVSISGDTAIVGASQDNDDGNLSGSAYVFVKPGGGWTDATEDAKLTASDAATEDFFGISVSISVDTAIVGAKFDDNNGGSDSGSAYIFGPSQAIGGVLIPVENTMVLLVGTHSVAAWMIPVIVSAIGIGIVIARKY